MNFRVKSLLVLLCLTGVFFFLRSHVLLQPCSCADKDCSCVEISEDERWFMEHFNKSVEPFLTAKSKLSESTFTWWKRLQNEKGNYDVYEKTEEKLFQTCPPSDIKLSYRTCAVVGNSGNLKGSRYGPMINYHDVVLRMNGGRIRGYEADVGNKTTHQVVYPESATDLDSTTHLVLLPFKILDLQWLAQALTTGFYGKSYAPVKTKIKANKDLVMVINPAFIKYVHQSWLEGKGKYPSTGFVALFLALHVCDKISVFGYGADKDGNWSHYWEKLANKQLKTGVHPGSQEYEIILRLSKQQKIQFYTGW